MVEGFLEITGITAPSSASEGNEVNFTIHTKNTGGADDFKVELSGNLTHLVEFYLEGNQELDIDSSFIMPNYNIIVNVTTYHLGEEIVGWIWDTTSVWDVNKWF